MIVPGSLNTLHTSVLWNPHHSFTKPVPSTYQYPELRTVSTHIFHHQRITYPSPHYTPQTRSHSPSHSSTAQSTCSCPAYSHRSSAKTQPHSLRHSPPHSNTVGYYLHSYNGCESSSLSPPCSKFPQTSMSHLESPRCTRRTWNRSSRNRFGSWRR
jgi:hypothetical protein